MNRTANWQAHPICLCAMLSNWLSVGLQLRSRQNPQNSEDPNLCPTTTTMGNIVILGSPGIMENGNYYNWDLLQHDFGLWQSGRTLLDGRLEILMSTA